MKGSRTILVGLALAIIPNVLDHLAGINWIDYVGPTWAPVIAGGLMITMRIATTTGVFRK